MKLDRAQLRVRDLQTLQALIDTLGRNPSKRECASVGLHFSHSSGFSSRTVALEALGREVDYRRAIGNYRMKDARMVSEEQALPEAQRTKKRRCDGCHQLTGWTEQCPYCHAPWKRVA